MNFSVPLSETRAERTFWRNCSDFIAYQVRKSLKHLTRVNWKNYLWRKVLNDQLLGIRRAASRPERRDIRGPRRWRRPGDAQGLACSLRQESHLLFGQVHIVSDLLRDHWPPWSSENDRRSVSGSTRLSVGTGEDRGDS